MMKSAILPDISAHLASTQRRCAPCPTISLFFIQNSQPLSIWTSHPCRLIRMAIFPSSTTQRCWTSQTDIILLMFMLRTFMEIEHLFPSIIKKNQTGESSCSSEILFQMPWLLSYRLGWSSSEQSTCVIFLEACARILSRNGRIPSPSVIRLLSSHGTISILEVFLISDKSLSQGRS